uniref:Uncharacterized protein n=1 Tax=Salmo trutta TaxID=8032 RepID=A0A674ELX9_SALTR
LLLYVFWHRFLSRPFAWLHLHPFIALLWLLYEVTITANNVIPEGEIDIHTNTALTHPKS